MISWAHHSIKQKLQKLPTWNKASQRKSLRKTNGCAIEAKNDEAEEALHSGIFDSNIFQVCILRHGPKAGFNFTLEGTLLPGVGF